MESGKIATQLWKQEVVFRAPRLVPLRSKNKPNRRANFLPLSRLAAVMKQTLAHQPCATTLHQAHSLKLLPIQRWSLSCHADGPLWHRSRRKGGTHPIDEKNMKSLQKAAAEKEGVFWALIRVVHGHVVLRSCFNDFLP